MVSQAHKKLRNKGVAEEKIKVLPQKLMSVKGGSSPSPAEMQVIINDYLNGQYGDAEKLALLFTKKFPRHSFGWKILGAIYKALGRMTDALAAGKRAVELDPRDNEAHNTLGAILEGLDRLEEAETSYVKALKLKPDDAEALYNLGGTLELLGRLEEAEASYRKATALKPGFAEGYNNLGHTLKELGRLGEAEASFRHALELRPQFVQACYNLGTLLYEGSKFKEAAEQFALIDFDMSNAFLLRCLYMEDQQFNFYKQLDHVVNQGENNALIGSLVSQSNIRYGVDRYNSFCSEPLKYVLKTDLLEQCDFKAIFIDCAVEILGDQKVQRRQQNLLVNGVQTAGNIFTQPRPDLDVIQKFIQSEAEKYRGFFQHSNEGLITSWPAEYSLIGWLVSMKSGGELSAHMHERGWISGSIYINVPPKSNTDRGNLVVGLGDASNGSGAEDNRLSIDVVTGSLCLFPSSLHHYTIPFESEEDRIVLAFDIVPKN